MPDFIPPERELCFPNLNRTLYCKTSEETSDYNCLAYAAGDQSQWWQPPFLGIAEPGHYWPLGAAETSHVSSLISAYQTLGFELCDNGELVPGFEKVALYSLPSGEMAHAARQTPEGLWSSKLGDWEDICHHTLDALEGPTYGSVTHYMRRKMGP